jgi:hypothetical protein
VSTFVYSSVISTFSRADCFFCRRIGKLVKLTQSGVTEQDIINIAAIFEKYVAGKDRESFVSDLEVYGGLKSAIQELSKQYDRLKMDVSSLQQAQKDNQLIQGSLTISETKSKSMEVVRDSLKTPEDEFAGPEILVPLLKAARGEKVEVGRLKDAITSALDLVMYKIGQDKQASFVFKNAKGMINAQDEELGTIASQQNDIRDIY